MQIVNLTPHTITIRPIGGADLVIPSSGVARVATSAEALGGIPLGTVGGPCECGASVGDCHVGCPANYPLPALIPVNRQVFGEVTGLPAPVEGTIYIVSAVVLARCPGRADVFGPDTGPTAIREGGQVVAVRGLVAAPEVL